MSVIEYTPQRFFVRRIEEFYRLQDFFRERGSVTIVETIHDSLQELCRIRYPRVVADKKQFALVWKNFFASYTRGSSIDACGVWIFFPWINTMVHILEPHLFEEVRTARNKKLITAEEQKRFRDCRVAVAGLSVGSHAAITIAMQGGGHEMRLADFDRISLSNLNRIRAGVDQIGKNKAVSVSLQILLMNPYARLTVYNQGLTADRIHEFLMRGGKKVDVVVEEMDDIALKIAIRREAKRLRIPVVMAADNADGIILDIERFDIDGDTPILRGRVDHIDVSALHNATRGELADVITKLIDPSVVRPRMLESVAEVGKTLYSWPQLGSAAQIAGSALAYAVRMIATGGPLKSGRTILSLEDVLSFITNYES